MVLTVAQYWIVYFFIMNMNEGKRTLLIPMVVFAYGCGYYSCMKEQRAREENEERVVISMNVYRYALLPMLSYLVAED